MALGRVLSGGDIQEQRSRQVRRASRASHPIKDAEKSRTEAADVRPSPMLLTATQRQRNLSPNLTYRHIGISGAPLPLTDAAADQSQGAEGGRI